MLHLLVDSTKTKVYKWYILKLSTQKSLFSNFFVNLHP